MEKSEKELLIEANGILRSCYSVIERKGDATNWDSLEKRVSKILKEQYEYFFPTLKQIRIKKLNRLNEQNPE
jgi:hypothetical protein